MTKNEKDSIDCITDYLDTKATFIGLLKEGDEDIWTAFYDKYALLILNFAMKRGCSRELAEDVLQETAFALFRFIPEFDYERKKGKFRSFLFKITESKIVDSFRRRKKLNVVENTDLIEKRDSGDNKLDFAYSQQLWDQAWEASILAQAMEKVRKRVKKKTFQCFEKVFIERLPIKEVAEKLDVTPNLIYQHKHKVLKLIVEEAKLLRKQYGE